MLHQDACLCRVQEAGNESGSVQQQLGCVAQYPARQQEGVVCNVRLVAELPQPLQAATGCLQELAQQFSCRPDPAQCWGLGIAWQH